MPLPPITSRENDVTFYLQIERQQESGRTEGTKYGDIRSNSNIELTEEHMLIMNYDMQNIHCIDW